MRIPWDDYFMLIAKLVSTRSTCLKRRVGAVIVKDKRILATGYNGQLPEVPHCGEHPCDKCPSDYICSDYDLQYISCAFHVFGDRPIPCWKEQKGNRRYCRAIHAEANAILQAAKMGISLKGTVLYCTLKPCSDCIKMIASVGIKRVYYELDYYHDDPDLWRFWEAESGLEFVELKVSDEALALAQEALNPWTSARRKN